MKKMRLCNARRTILVVTSLSRNVIGHVTIPLSTDDFL